jgi:hypothetical protein
MKSLLGYALLALPLAAGCSSSSSTVTPSNSAELRVINASPDAGPLDVYFQGQLAVDSLPFPFANPYLFVQSGAATVTVRAHGSINLLLESTPTFTTNSFYTYAVTGPSTALTSVLLTDDTTSAPAGSFKLRMVHLAPAGPAMDLYYTAPTDDISTATPIVTGLAYTQASAYLTPATGTGRLRVTQTGTKTVLIDSGTLTLSNGEVATLFVTGSASNGGGAPYSGQLLNP